MISYLLLTNRSSYLLTVQCSSSVCSLSLCKISLLIHSFKSQLQLPIATPTLLIQSKSKLEQHTTRQTFQLPFHAFAFGVTPEKEHVPHLTSRRDHTHIHNSPHSPRLASLVHFLLPLTLLLMSEAFFFLSFSIHTTTCRCKPQRLFHLFFAFFSFSPPPLFFANESLSISLSYFFPFPSSIEFDYNEPE